jgi:hypothetical protein
LDQRVQLVFIQRSQTQVFRVALRHVHLEAFSVMPADLLSALKSAIPRLFENALSLCICATNILQQWLTNEVKQMFLSQQSMMVLK